MTRFIVLVFFVLVANSLSSQCVLQDTGFPAEANNFKVADLAGPNGQTFVACQSGPITSISIKMDATNIYNGLMNLWITDGIVLDYHLLPVYQVWNVTAPITGVQTINLNVLYDVVAGNTYTFGISADGVGSPVIDGNIPNLYPAGGAIINSGAGGSIRTDANCTFSVTIGSSAIPTLSQWGLMICGILLLILGVLGVRRMSWTQQSGKWEVYSIKK